MTYRLIEYERLKEDKEKALTALSEQKQQFSLLLDTQRQLVADLEEEIHKVSQTLDSCISEKFSTRDGSG